MMADVTGPISTLPGSTHCVPSGTMCDDHADRPAVARVQGETDSFGSEMMDMCAECFAALSRTENHNAGGICDWCKQEVSELHHRRDYEEGSCGPVYQVCEECWGRYLKACGL